jgi:hypothetical protein
MVTSVTVIPNFTAASRTTLALPGGYVYLRFVLQELQPWKPFWVTKKGKLTNIEFGRKVAINLELSCLRSKLTFLVWEWDNLSLERVRIAVSCLWNAKTGQGLLCSGSWHSASHLIPLPLSAWWSELFPGCLELPVLLFLPTGILWGEVPYFSFCLRP